VKTSEIYGIISIRYGDRPKLYELVSEYVQVKRFRQVQASFAPRPGQPSTVYVQVQINQRARENR
jgi:hypothetical protein